MKVRPAELWDVPALFDLAERFHAEAAAGFPLPEPQAIHQTILECQRFGVLCCLVAEEEKIIGFLTGACSRFPHSMKSIAGMTMFYVSKEKRGTVAARRLLEEFMGWCRSNAASVVCCGSISGIKEERFGMFLEKQGFRKAGAAYVREL